VAPVGRIPPPSPFDFSAREAVVHGHRVQVRIAGTGPPVVLVHGMLNSSRHWEPVARRLAAHHTVIAPDLIGHGDSATPRGDYSLGAHAAMIRDLLALLGVERATIVGHSLGGGVAMQFFYQFPQRIERLILVSSGGLGPDVSPLLRTAALPGASAVLRLATQPRLLDTLWKVGGELRRRRIGQGVAVQAIVRALRPLSASGSREAFLHTLRAVIDLQGQRVDGRDRLYLLGALPVLIVWGGRDHTIPVAHGEAARDAIPGARLEILPGAAHFPHLEDPAGLAAALAAFVANTPGAVLEEAGWAELLAPRSHPPHLQAPPAPPVPLPVARSR
jgi:pimeloyl-ACP methyl ester carboxylesterase